MVKVNCPRCKIQFAVPECLVGQNGTCPACGCVAVIESDSDLFETPETTRDRESGRDRFGLTRNQEIVAVAGMALLAAVFVVPPVSLWLYILLLIAAVAGVLVLCTWLRKRQINLGERFAGNRPQKVLLLIAATLFLVMLLVPPWIEISHRQVVDLFGTGHPTEVGPTTFLTRGYYWVFDPPAPLRVLPVRVNISRLMAQALITVFLFGGLVGIVRNPTQRGTV